MLGEGFVSVEGVTGWGRLGLDLGLRLGLLIAR